MFLAMTPDYTRAERNSTALKTSIYFVLILSIFFLAGSYILGFFGVSINAVRIAGGIIILMSGFALLNGKSDKDKVLEQEATTEAKEREDISFAPMAMPMLSGPGSISLLIGFHSEYPDWTQRLVILGTILATGVIVFSILRFSPIFIKLIGKTGLNSISRIMGFLVMSIGIQYIITGIVNLVETVS